MKRLIAMLLAVGMAFSAVPTFADNSADTDYAVIISTVREVFDLPEDLSNVQISSYGDSTSINWKYENGGREYYVNTDEHGCITNYYSYNYMDYYESMDMSVGEKLTKEQAQKKADHVINTLYADNAEDFICDDVSIDMSEVSFVYYYTQNGIKINDAVYINVDRASGDINNFYGVCGEIFDYKYTSPDEVKLVDNDKIFEIYKEKGNFKLVYDTFYNYDTDETTIKPVYIITPVYIDAVNGGIVDESDDDYMRNSAGYDGGFAAAEETMYDTDYETKITDYEQKAIDDYQNLISKNEADKIVKKYFPDVKNMKIDDSRVYWNNGGAVIEVNYNNDDEYSYAYAYATLDAQTGEVLSYSNYSYDYNEPYEEPKPLEERKAREKAEKLVRSLAPAIYDSGEYEVESNDDNTYVNFNRLHNGIPVTGQSIYVGFGKDYKVTSYYRNWRDYDFPELEGLADEKAVFETSQKGGANFDLTYQITSNGPVLAYGYKESGWYMSYYYDAFTGERIDGYSGEPYEEASNGEYTDIENSPYKNTIETLSEYGYILPYTEFEPDKNITIEDFCTFLGVPSYYVSDLYTDTEMEKEMTKYDMATIFVELMGYSDLAEKDIFINNFTDVEDKYIGVVTIASAMNFIRENSGEFNGNSMVTRGQAAEYIYNILAENNML